MRFHDSPLTSVEVPGTTSKGRRGASISEPRGTGPDTRGPGTQSACRALGRQGVATPTRSSRRLRRDVEHDAVHVRDLVRDAVRDLREGVVGQARPVRGHGVLRGHRTQHDRVTVGAAVALDTHGADVGEQDDRALPDLFVEAGRGEFLAGDLVGGTEQLEAVLRDLTDDADTEPRAGERLASDDDLGQPELAADRADLVLEQRAERLDEFERHVLGQAADVVVRLDVRRAGTAAGLDDVGVERALDEELDLARVGVRRRGIGAGFEHEGLGRRLERADELAADDLALLLRVAHTASASRNCCSASTVTSRTPVEAT